MKYRGERYEQLIKKLRPLARKNMDAYKKLMTEIAGEFGISEKTIYRDMRKRIPGLRKTRSDAGKDKSRVTKKEIKIAEELISGGTQMKKVKAIIETKTNKKVSGRKLNKISKQLKIVVPGHLDPPAGRAGTPSSSSALDDPIKQESVFGDEAKEFFEKLFDFNLIAPDKGIPLTYNGKRFIVQKDDLADIILILANAYNRAALSEKEKLPVDRDILRREILMQMMEFQMRLAKESCDLKAVDALTRMHDRMNESVTWSPDFGILEKVCKDLRPSITTSEIITLVKKHAGAQDD